MAVALVCIVVTGSSNNLGSIVDEVATKQKQCQKEMAECLLKKGTYYSSDVLQCLKDRK